MFGYKARALYPILGPGGPYNRGITVKYLSQYPTLVDFCIENISVPFRYKAMGGLVTERDGPKSEQV